MWRGCWWREDDLSHQSSECSLVGKTRSSLGPKHLFSAGIIFSTVVWLAFLETLDQLIGLLFDLKKTSIDNLSLVKINISVFPSKCFFIIRIKSSPKSSQFIFFKIMTQLISRMPANTKIKTKINRKDYKKENKTKKKSFVKMYLAWFEVALSRVLNFGITPHFHTLIWKECKFSPWTPILKFIEHCWGYFDK